MPKVFISYRRGDTKHAAGRLSLSLRTYMPRTDIFIDIQSIQGGDDFPDRYESWIAANADVLLALIGGKWAEDRRLHHPENHVRREILAAQRSSVSILPVMLDDSEMPKAAELPIELQFMCTLNGVRLGHESFEQDTDQLFKAVRDLADAKSKLVPLPAFLREQMELELERTRKARLSRDLTRLKSNVKLAAEYAQHAELRAIECQYRARSAAENASAAARRARGRGNGLQTREIIRQDGRATRWAGEGTYDKRDGFSEYESPTQDGGTYSYRGHWKDNRESGFGVSVFTDADGTARSRIEGEMVDGKRQGHGVWLKAGDRYLGEFRDDRFEGAGVYCWDNGNRFEGEWRAGKRWGFGVQWRRDGSMAIEGEWDDDRLKKS